MNISEQKNLTSFLFFRIPKALFTEKEFASLSTDAKLLYGILLDRISLSKKNGWIDSDGYVYIIYTIAELQDLLRMSHTTVTKLLYELDSVHGIGLIERYRQGNNRPSVIYVKNFVKRSRGKPVRYFHYEDKDTGKKIYTTEVYANRIEFAGAKMVDRPPFPEDAEGFLEIPEGMEEEMPFR